MFKNCLIDLCYMVFDLATNILVFISSQIKVKPNKACFGDAKLTPQRPLCVWDCGRILTEPRQLF